MICQACGRGNPADSAFCEECGTRLESTCPSCGASLSAEAKFCRKCGVALGGSAAASAPDEDAAQRAPLDYTPKHLAAKILTSRAALEGERKQVTVLFADVKGSMELAERVDAEQWHRILDRFFQILSEGVHRFEGTVNQYTGDGIMALFGAPIAHEDHAQRACYASLRLLDELREYSREMRRAHGLDFAVRIGLNSGEVVVGRIGDDLRMDYTAQGHTVGLAQRMESLAEPNSCALSESTSRLVSGYFELEDLGAFSVKGVAEPLAVFALRGVGAMRTRLDVSRTRGFTKFVGREREIETLERALEDAFGGRGQVVGVVAEAGTGKSRLCAEFVARCRERSIRVNTAHCPAHGKTVAYLPLLEVLREIFSIDERDSDQEARRKIAGELVLLDEAFQDLLPLVFDFLGVSDPEHPAPDLPPEGRQRKLMAFVRHLTEARGRQEPTVLLVDDLHWIDPGSDAFLAQTVEAVAATRMLVLVNFRPEYHADWMNKSYYHQLPLAPLGKEAIDALLADLLGVHPSVMALSSRIEERTGGNPFFIEEVVQSLVEDGVLEGFRGAYRLARPVESLEIPATVQSSLAARIDRLPENGKRVLQTAAVIGKEFSEPVLRRVAELPDEDLAAALSGLVRAEFAFEKSLYPDVVYAFKHPLTHEVAYGSQLAAPRARRHAAVARAIEEIETAQLEERAALLAQHWDQAGDVDMSAHWHRRAARWCALDNPREALRHWQCVREALRSAPDQRAAARPRLEAAIELLNSGWLHGLGEDEAEAVFEEGRALAEEVGDARQELLLLAFRSNVFGLSGAPAAGLPLAREALAIADRAQDPELRFIALDSLSDAYVGMGEADAALEVIDEMIEIGSALETDVDVRGLPVGSWQHAYRGYVLLFAGRLAEAGASLRLAEVQLREKGIIQPLTWCLAFTAGQRAEAGEASDAVTYGRRAIELAEQVASSLSLTLAYEFSGQASLAAGDARLATEQLEHTLDVARRTHGYITAEARVLARLAAARLAAGRLDAARSTAEEAVEVAVSRQTRAMEVYARTVLAQVLVELEGQAAKAGIDRELAQCVSLIDATGARTYLPHVHEIRARLAQRAGDGAAFERELREAHRLFVEIGASGYAGRIARELGT